MGSYRLATHAESSVMCTWFSMKPISTTALASYCSYLLCELATNNNCLGIVFDDKLPLKSVSVATSYYYDWLTSQ